MLRIHTTQRIPISDHYNICSDNFFRDVAWNISCLVWIRSILMLIKNSGLKVGWPPQFWGKMPRMTVPSNFAYFRSIFAKGVPQTEIIPVYLKVVWQSSNFISEYFKHIKTRTIWQNKPKHWAKPSELDLNTGPTFLRNSFRLQPFLRPTIWWC